MSETSREASDMLAAALLQMDGILAGSRPMAGLVNGHAEKTPTTPRSPSALSSPGFHHIASSNLKSHPSPKISASPRIKHRSPQQKASKLIDDLKSIMDSVEDKQHFIEKLPEEKQLFVKNYLIPQRTLCTEPKNSSISSPVTLEDKVTKLESDKESLMLQVSVLTDQVEAQGDKISDLLYSYEETKSKLKSSEKLLKSDTYSTPKQSSAWKKDLAAISPQHSQTPSRTNKELVSRTALETHKLDLMAEISTLKIRLASCEKGRRDVEDKLLMAQRKIDELQSRLNDKTIECAELRSKQRNGTIPGSNAEPTVYLTFGGRGSTSPHPLSRDSWRRWSFNDSRSSLTSLANGSADGSKERTLEREKTLERLKRKHTEVEKLKKAVESLMGANEEKERHIEELRRKKKKVPTATLR